MTDCDDVMKEIEDDLVDTACGDCKKENKLSVNVVSPLSCLTLFWKNSDYNGVNGGEECRAGN